MAKSQSRKKGGVKKLTAAKKRAPHYDEACQYVEKLLELHKVQRSVLTQLKSKLRQLKMN